MGLIKPTLSWACKSCVRQLFGSSIKSGVTYSTWTNSFKFLRDHDKVSLFRRIAYPSCGLSSASTSPSTIVELDYKAYVNEEEVDKILKTVNDIPDLEDLQRFGISKKSIKILQEKKEGNRKGVKKLVENIDDLVAILGLTSSLRTFGIILERNIPNLRNPMFPVPTKAMVQKSDKIVSIVLQGSQVSWCCIQRNDEEETFLVKQLEFKPVEFNSRQHFHSSLTEMMEICKTIPEAHLCIVEEYPGTAATKATMFPYLNEVTQLRSFLLGRLTARFDRGYIIAIKTGAVARLFNTVVGKERVSGQHLVDNMIIWKPLPSLIVPNRLKLEYENQDPVIKEGIVNSILLNLAYWKLTKQFTDSYL